jgi:hypothetical protein
MNHELETQWEEAAVAYLLVLCQHSRGVRREDHGNRVR